MRNRSNVSQSLCDTLSAENPEQILPLWCNEASGSTVLIKDTFAYFGGSRDHSLFRRRPQQLLGSLLNKEDEDAIFKLFARIRRRRTPSRTLSHALFLLARSSHAALGWSICNTNEYSTSLRVCTSIDATAISTISYRCTIVLNDVDVATANHSPPRFHSRCVPTTSKLRNFSNALLWPTLLRPPLSYSLSLSLSLYWLVSTRSPVGSRKILSALITQTTRYLGLASSSSSSHTTVSSTRSFCMVLSSLYPSQARVYFRDRLDKWLIKDTPS